MVYNKTKWQDEIPDLTKPILDTSGKQKTDPQTGRPLFELVQTGTRITSAKLNNIEDGIESSHTLTERLAAEVTGNFVVSGFDFTVNGLAAAWKAGVGYVNGRRYDVPAGSLTLTTKQGQYIYLDSTGTVQKIADEATARVGLLLWYFATDASKVITNTDSRRFIGPESYALKSETVPKETGKGLSANDYTDSEKAKLQQHDERLTDIFPRLNTASSTTFNLQPGTQTITVPRDVPFNVTNLTGRMLLNLLGRAGTFDSLAGWNFTGGTGTISTAQSVYGTNALLFNLSATSGRITRTVPTTAGSKYLIAAEIRIGTAVNANLFVSSGPAGAAVSTTAQYQLSYALYTAAGSSMDVGIGVVGSNSQTVYIDGFRVYELSSTEFSAAGSMDRTGIAARYPYTEGFAGIKNPYAIRWTNKDKTDIAAMLAFDAELLSGPASDTDADKLQQGVDGQYYKTSNWRRVTLDGSQNWMLFGRQTGYTVASLSTFGAAKDSGYVLKYTGSVLQRFLTGSPIPGADAHVLTDSITANPNLLAITISNADSGWNDGYSPSIGELKAYFWGWIMGTQSNGVFTAGYNGSGTKAWRGMVDDNGSGTTNLPTVYFREQYPQPSWQPYQLMYKFSAARKEPVLSEGALALSQGDNVVETGSGLILREKAKPISSGDGTAYYINARSTFPVSSLVYNSARPLLVYRNGLQDGWGQDNDADAFGSRQAGIGSERFDKNAVYTVTYFARVSFPAAVFMGGYPETERAMLNDLIQDVQQITQRVSVVENTKQNTFTGLNWLTPTLLSGVETDEKVQYAKTSDGIVLVRGSVRLKSTGSITLFRFVDGYKPSADFTVLPVWGYSSTSGGSAEGLSIAKDGTVAINPGRVYDTWLRLDNIRFFAEN
ncbi:hypothetical protein [Paenibacillus kandeliae]|uniref:hypothetical protein n=1 Tax=Paenibacillus kandeliae TaxID=3231269 RepID=UPI003457712D